MDFNSINEFILANPASLFVLGLVVGFFLCGLMGSVFTFSLSKKPSRYRARKSNDDVKSSATVIDFKEPISGWSENTVRNIAQRSSRYTGEANQSAKNIQQVAE
jgi:hypothetical protein